MEVYAIVGEHRIPVLLVSDHKASKRYIATKKDAPAKPAAGRSRGRPIKAS